MRAAPFSRGGKTMSKIEELDETVLRLHPIEISNLLGSRCRKCDAKIEFRDSSTIKYLMEIACPNDCNSMLVLVLPD
jgi:hypothetical protein